MPYTKGELNFLISKLCIEWVERHGLSYDSISDVRATLGLVWDEFYRRVGAPYEDKKIEENGDVYPTWQK